MDSDRIEKKVLLRAPLARVWQAISDARQFGSWFGMEFDGPFAERTHLTGRITMTTADPEIAKLQQPHVGKTFEFHVESIEPFKRISFRWHPHAVEPGADYSREPMTLITFELEETSAGVQLTITESGFNQIPLARRAQAFESNQGGWEAQTQLISKYLALHP